MKLFDKIDTSDLLSMCNFTAKYLNEAGLDLKLSYNIVRDDNNNIIGVVAYKIKVGKTDDIVSIELLASEDSKDGRRAEQLLLGNLSVKFSYKYQLEIRKIKTVKINSLETVRYLEFIDFENKFKKSKQKRAYNTRLREYIEFKMTEKLGWDLIMSPSKHHKYSKIRREVTQHIGKSTKLSEQDYIKAITVVDEIVK